MHKIGEIVEAKGQVFQGDIFIDVSDLPKGATEMKPDKNGLFVFAEGETTGHVHAIREEDARVFYANDNSVIGGKRFFVVPKNKNAVLFHGVPSAYGLPDADKGDHAWFKVGDKIDGKKKVREIIRQRVLDLTDPSNFRQVAD